MLTATGVSHHQPNAPMPRSGFVHGPIALIRCPKYNPSLIQPRQCRALGKLHDSDGCDLSVKDQLFQYLGCEICQSQLATYMPLREVQSDCKIPDRAELTGLHAPPPAPCPANGPLYRAKLATRCR